MPTISRRLLVDTVATRLVGVTNAVGYVGQIGSLNGLPGVTGTPDDPPRKSPSDPRIAPYFVLEPQAGTESDDAGLGDCLIDLDWPFTVRAVAGDIHDLLALVDRIDALLWRWSPGQVGDAHTGRVMHQPGYTPPVVRDTTQTPHRLFTPLQYRLVAHI